MKRAAVTLVELLVVIGIITVLVAILLPVLSKARQQAMVIKCQAHLQQLGVAFSLYGSDFKGFLPAARVHDPPRTRNYYWMEHVAPYLQRRTKVKEIAEERDRSVLWGCPAWVNRKPSDVWNTGYGYNVWPLNPVDLWPNTDSARSVWIEPANGMNGRYFKLAQVPHRSQRGMVADHDEWSITLGNWSPNTPGVVDYGLDTARHGPAKGRGNANVLFYDGHVSAVVPTDCMYVMCDPMRTTKKH